MTKSPETKTASTFHFPTPEQLLAEKYRDYFTLSGYATGHSNPYLTGQTIAATGTAVPTHAVLGRDVAAGKVAIKFTQGRAPGARALRFNEMMTNYDIALASILRPWNIRKAPKGKVIIIPARLVTDDPNAGIYMELNVAAREIVDSPRPTQAQKEAKAAAKTKRAAAAQAKRDAKSKGKSGSDANKAAAGEGGAQAEK